MIKFFRDLKKYWAYMVYSAKCELKKEVADSYLNWIWWILEPLCFMMVYALIFGYFFNAKKEYFEAFIFIGLTLWNFFNKTVHSSVRLVKANRSIISKVYLPKYVLVLEKMMVNGFKMLISFGIVVLLMVVLRVQISFRVFLAIPILIPLVLVTFGMCTIVLHFGVFVEDLKNIINIGMKVVFYLTGIFYSLEDRAGHLGLVLQQYNPLAFLITSMRECLLYQKTPNFLWLGVWTLLGLVLSFIGVKLIQKNENSYAKVL